MNRHLRTIVTFFILIIGIAVAIFILIMFTKEREKARAVEEEIQALELEKQRLEREYDNQLNKITYLQSEHFYEKEAKKLNYKKSGEHVVIVRNSNEQDNSGKNVEDNYQKEQLTQPHYLIWLNYFFK